MSDLVLLPYRRTAGKTDPAEVITITIGGRTFRAGRRTAAHLQVTFAAFAVEFPHLRLLVAQPCYNTGVAASAGTHDGDGVVDFYVSRDGSTLRSTEAQYWMVQAFLRRLGWGAGWFRHTGSWAARSAWHLHASSLGCPGPVGIYVPGQVVDAYNHTYGLKGQHNVDLDKSWWPGDPMTPGPWPTGTTATWRAGLDATYFDYPAWERAQEDLMGWNDWTEKDRQDAAADIAAAIAPVVTKQLLGAFVDDGKTTVKASLRKVTTIVQLVRELANGIGGRAHERVATVADED